MMADKSKNKLLGLSSTGHGIASVIAPCLAFAMVWVIFNQGPDGPLNNMVAGVITIYLPLLLGCICGLIGVSAGIHHKNWLGGVIAALGTALNGLLVVWPMLNI
jgi:hypothetical protein